MKFTGFSKEVFLDALVERTGLNGRELFDYVLANLPGPLTTSNTEETTEEITEEETEPLLPTYEFAGSRKEIYHYLESLGARRYSANDTDWFPCLTDKALANCGANLTKSQTFIWRKPTGEIIYGINNQER